MLAICPVTGSDLSHKGTELMVQDYTPLATSQSLTLVGSMETNRADGPCSRAEAAFVTQLLASRLGVSVYRQKRRASPEEAQKAYLGTVALQAFTQKAAIRSLISIAA